MQRTLSISTLLLALPALFAIHAGAQTGFHDNTDKRLSCEQYDSGGEPRFCEMREMSVPVLSHLTIDARKNGGVSIKGWGQAQILVRARVEARAGSQAEASQTVHAITVETGNGTIHSAGPDDGKNWSVSYEIFMPHQTSVEAMSYNGGVSVADIGGALDLTSHNGGLSLTRVAGNVKGTTANGGITVALTGSRFNGNELTLTTTNGGINVHVPEDFSGHIQGSTVNGGFHANVGSAVQSSRGGAFDMPFGSGGPEVHLTTVNGGVSISRAEGKG